jgi:hypothetical protein
VRVSDLISFTFVWLDTDKPFQAIGFVAATVGSLFLAVHGLRRSVVVLSSKS